MNPIVTFLTTLGQAFSALALYGPAHPMRETAVQRLRVVMMQLMTPRQPVTISFLDDEIIFANRVVTDLRGWEWGARLAAAGVQRLEFTGGVEPTIEDVDAMLGELRARLSAPTEPSRPWSLHGIRLGPLAVSTEAASATPKPLSVMNAVDYPELDGEIEAVNFVHDEVSCGHGVPMAEVEAIVHGLAVTIHRERHVMLPLLDLRTFDEYTTTHSCNVAMLALGLSEALGLTEGDTRAIGTAALLHDIGKVRIPQEVLIKAGKLTPEERRLIESHPVEGARILSQRGIGNGLAATVAYEHHIWYDGNGGYPGFRFPRTTHYASRIVHVCDIYDALCSRRPYREAWSRDKALELIEQIAGIELDPAIATTFVTMARNATHQRQPMNAVAA